MFTRILRITSLLLVLLILVACGAPQKDAQPASAPAPKQSAGSSSGSGSSNNSQSDSSGKSEATPAPAATNAPAEVTEEDAADEAMDMEEAAEEEVEIEIVTAPNDITVSENSSGEENTYVLRLQSEPREGDVMVYMESNSLTPREGDVMVYMESNSLATPMPDTDDEEGRDIDIEREPTPIEINPFTLTSDDHFSTFAMDVDTASYASARNYITNGSLPYADEVRVEEFINYFDYDYTPPAEDALGISIDSAPSPWQSVEGPTKHIVRVGIKGKVIDDSERKDASLVFVIDISGSMSDYNRLPLVKEALKLLVEELRETDQIAVVVYSDDTRVVLQPTSAANRDIIIRAIDSLEIEGSTNVEGGLKLGYEVAAENFKVGGINRVILCSDGVANVGATGPDAIRQVIRDHTAQGVFLTTVGFGMGDYNDYLMEQLADDGNGNYAYVDNLDEANRIFVENLTGMLQVIAKDSKIQVDFNPEVVHSYRLLGYENRDVADEDFRNDKVDAGEVGSGHNVTALYEVILHNGAEGEALKVYIRYKDPDGSEVAEIEQPFATSDFGQDFVESSPQLQLAVAVAGFAEKLRGSGYAESRSLADISAIAERIAPEFANDEDVQEFVRLVAQAREIAGE